MYFLRRRHGRKSQSDQRPRRDAPPPQAQAQAPVQAVDASQQSAAEYAQHAELVAPRPVVITKTKRPRVETPDDENAFKPAGTFRAGTLHIAHAAQSASGHGKL